VAHLGADLLGPAAPPVVVRERGLVRVRFRVRVSYPDPDPYPYPYP